MSPFTPPPPCTIPSAAILPDPLSLPSFPNDYSSHHQPEAGPSRYNPHRARQFDRHQRSATEPISAYDRPRRCSVEAVVAFEPEGQHEREFADRVARSQQSQRDREREAAPLDSSPTQARTWSSMSWCRPREAEAPVMTPASTACPASDVNDSPRARFMSAFGLALPKSISREEDDVPDQMPCSNPSISIVVPESLPTCHLKTAFQNTENNVEIPPAFYPGQSIPTVLTFELDRYSCLRHALNPILTMSLVGTLTIPESGPRTIICVSVSLSEGMALWARDAAQAYAGRTLGHDVPDVTVGLPGGTYSLPLTVQVPTTPRLPPTFDVNGATFSVTYSLNVNLTCDDPQTGSRVVLAESGRAFEMLPETLPTRAPRFAPQSFWVRMGSHTRQPNYRWSVRPMLPTTTFSPTSTIPLELEFAPPKETPDQEFQIAIRIALVRREHTSYGFGPVDPNVNDQLVQDHEVVVRWGWIEADGHSTVRIPNIDLPLMIGSQWKNGYSTMLNVGSARSQYGQNHITDHAGISVASTFHLCITLAFAQHTLRDILPPAARARMPPPGVFGPATTSEDAALSLVELKRTFPGTVRTLPIPIVIGSVAEPRDAMHISRWSDLQLERRNGRERGRMIHGEALSCEDGWVCPPPAYAEALGVVPYHYG